MILMTHMLLFWTKAVGSEFHIFLRSNEVTHYENKLQLLRQVARSLFC